MLHKFKRFVQHVFKYTLVAVSVFKLGMTVLFCVFSRFRHLILAFVMDKLMFISATESKDILRLTFDNMFDTLLTIPETF